MPTERTSTGARKPRPSLFPLPLESDGVSSNASQAEVYAAEDARTVDILHLLNSAESLKNIADSDVAEDFLKLSRALIDECRILHAN
jgi:hypothetical protein